jgi:hypothetical protein
MLNSQPDKKDTSTHVASAPGRCCRGRTWSTPASAGHGDERGNRVLAGALRRNGSVVKMCGGKPGASRDAEQAEWTEEDRILWSVWC